MNTPLFRKLNLEAYKPGRSFLNKKKSIIKFISQNQIKVTINLIYDSSEKKFNDRSFILSLKNGYKIKKEK